MISLLVRTLFSRFLLLLVFVLFSVPLLIILCLPERWVRDNRTVFGTLHLLYRAILACTLIPITYKGLENMPDEPVILAANHQSSLDIPIVGSLLGGDPHLWLARSELLDSWWLRILLNKFAVVVEVASPMKAMRSLLQVIALIKDKRRHLIIFPEGQRYDDGNIHEFFAGFVILAKKTDRPIVPVRIINLNKVYPRDSFLVHWYPVTVIIGKPMRIEHDESDEAFQARVRQWFCEQSAA
jgi:1-acyl-sn-glycerol-3-phosphate acyltransferase